MRLYSTQLTVLIRKWHKALLTQVNTFSSTFKNTHCVFNVNKQSLVNYDTIQMGAKIPLYILLLLRKD